jgi:hypothetical protein
VYRYEICIPVHFFSSAPVCMLNRTTIITRGGLIWWLLFTYAPSIKIWLMDNNFCHYFLLFYNRCGSFFICNILIHLKNYFHLLSKFLRHLSHVMLEKSHYKSAHTFSYFIFLNYTFVTSPVICTSYVFSTLFFRYLSSGRYNGMVHPLLK